MSAAKKSTVRKASAFSTSNYSAAFNPVKASAPVVRKSKAPNVVKQASTFTVQKPAAKPSATTARARKASAFSTSNYSAVFNAASTTSVASVGDASIFRAQGGRSGGSINHGRGLGIKAPTGGQNGAAPARNYPNSGTNRDQGHKRTPKPPTVRPPAPAPKPAGYTVRKGDNLWNIVKARLPKGSTDKQILDYTNRTYNANRAVIGNNPNLIKPGQIIFPNP